MEEMTTLKHALLCLTALLALTAAGCSDEEKTPAAQAPANPSPQAQTEAALEMEKWNSYVDLANFVDPVVRYYLASYMEHFPGSRYTRPGASFHYDFEDVRNPVVAPEKAIRAARSNAHKGTAHELDILVQLYAPALDSLYRVLRESNDYYMSKDFLHDGFARGKELHARVVEAAKAYAPLEEAFFTALKDEEARMLEREIVALRQNGHRVQPAMLMVIAQGRRMEAELGRRERPQPNLDRLRPFYDELSEALSELEATVADPVQIDQEGLDRKNTLEMLDSARELQHAAATLLENVQEPEPELTTVEISSGDYSRELESLTEQYNALITAH